MGRFTPRPSIRTGTKIEGMSLGLSAPPYRSEQRLDGQGIRPRTGSVLVARLMEPARIDAVRMETLVRSVRRGGVSVVIGDQNGWSGESLAVASRVAATVGGTLLGPGQDPAEAVSAAALSVDIGYDWIAWLGLEAPVSETLRIPLGCILTAASSGAGIAEAIDSAGVPARTLRDRLARARLPPPAAGPKPPG